MKIYGYARVSSRDQNLTRQLEAFRQFGVPEKCIFSDKKSGKDFDRTNYLRMIGKLRRGDLVVVKSIDRLGRNYGMIIEEWSRITRRIGADILVLDMPLLDTRSHGDSLIGKFISDIVLQVLSFVAENERDNIRVRQAEGISAARLKGVRFGRPRCPSPENFDDIRQEYLDRTLSLQDALDMTGLKKSTFYCHVYRANAELLERADFLRDQPLPTGPFNVHPKR